MSTPITQHPSFYEALKVEGLELPRNCHDVELIAPVDGMYMLRFQVFLEGEDLVKVGRALSRIGLGTIEGH